MKKDFGVWLQETSRFLQPKEVHLCTGSEKEREMLIRKMQDHGELLALDKSLYPNSFLHRSNPNDVARTEQVTFIATRRKADAGPTNNWMSPSEAKAATGAILYRAMRGRVMYVIPYLMGPRNSPYSRPGIMVTDSPYVVLSMHIMARVDPAVYRMDPEKIVFGIHALHELNPEKRMVVHFPEEDLIWSVGSGYGGNALLGKKCHGLRLASWQGKNEGWLAEHMLIIGVEDPDGRTTYLAAAFPSACGKTNLAMLRSALPGWNVWTVSDDLCWMYPGPDGMLRAINPERGFFAVASGTSERTNPNMLSAIRKGNTIFTNVGVTPDGMPWWEGLNEVPPTPVLDWQGRVWSPGLGPVSHPNARFTVGASQCPSISGFWEDPEGVPISGIIFGGRNSRTIPLVTEARTWEEGVYYGATLRSQTTAATTDTIGVMRCDPMAMIPFCGYNMADYFSHWIRMKEKIENPPKIFRINWFRRGADGKLLWPGFGENIRVLKWMVGRIHGDAWAMESPLGFMPQTLDIDGLGISSEAIRELFRVDEEGWREELDAAEEFFSRFGDRIFPDHPLRQVKTNLERELGLN